MLRTYEEFGRTQKNNAPRLHVPRYSYIQMCSSISGIRLRLARAQQWNHSAKTNDTGTNCSAVNTWRTINGRLTASNGFFSIGIYYTRRPSFNFKLFCNAVVDTLQLRSFEQDCSVWFATAQLHVSAHFVCIQDGPKFEIKLLGFYGDDRLWWFLSSHWRFNASVKICSDLNRRCA